MYSQNLFSKKKKNYMKPILFTVLLVGILGFCFWMSQGDIKDSEKNKGNFAKVTEDKKDQINQEGKDVIKKVDENSITEDLANNYSAKKENAVALEAGKTEKVKEGDKFDKSEKSEEAERAKKDEEMIAKASKAYYLVKEVDGLVNIFYYSTEGKEKLIRITGIPYDLLSESDQKLFQKGVMKYSIDELNDLLQDFES